jgi:uncharacterized membrane-anchored protein YitT (DUF2179 family)
MSKKSNVFNYIKVTLLAFVLALSYILFIVPNHFAPAGLNGIATMVQYKLGFSIGYFSLIINVPLCILAYFYVNKDFALKTLVFSLAYSLFYLILQQINLSSFIYDAGNVDTLFPCLVAGLISGFIYGICFRANASTGGSDIISKYVSKRKPNLNYFWITFTINAVVALISFFVYGTEVNGIMTYSYKPVCLCVIYCFIASFVGNYILKGYVLAYRFIIVTEHADEIEKEIIEKLKHTATRVKAQGSYTHKDKDMLICIVNKHQIVDCKLMLKKYDNTFITVDPISETIGNFKKIK